MIPRILERGSAMKSLRRLVLVSMLMVGVFMSGGCVSAAPDVTPGTAAIDPTPSGRHSSSGCWLAAVDMTNCGALVSVSGESPDGQTARLPGTVRVSSSVFSPDGDYVELTVRVAECSIWTTPMRVVGDAWEPLIERKVVAASGCAQDTASDSLGWVEDMLDHSFRVRPSGTSQVRFESNHGSVDFMWE